MADIRMKGFQSTTPIDKALEIFTSRLTYTPQTETVRIEDALGRIIAEDIFSPIDLPPFNRSAMDGYAVKSQETIGASVNNPIKFKIIGHIEAGHYSPVTLNTYEAVEIMTGGKVPDTADAVIMLEYTNKLSENEVEIYQSVTPYQNIDPVGSDIKKGDKVLTSGTILEPADLGVLKSMGVSKVRVFFPLKIGVLSTGDELSEDISNGNEGKIIENNQIILSSYIRKEGCTPHLFGIIPDEGSKIKQAIQEASASCDLLLVTGGTSVGKKDLVPNIIRELGEIVIHGVSMKPGRPTGLAFVNNKPVILMPGYSVACIIAFYAFVKPIIYKMFNLENMPIGCIIRAKLTRRIPSTAGRTDFIRVKLHKENGEFYATPIMASGSGILSSMVKSNGLLKIPENVEGYEEDDVVPIILTRKQIPEVVK
ncbi:MAG: molybdopterin molybdotransferase MoeA [Candidatus Odinarchaeia archaeon]